MELRGTIPNWMSGNGYGYGYGDYWLSVIASFAEGCAVPDGARLAFWKSDREGRPVNGGNKHQQAFPGRIDKIEGPLKICTKNALHATYKIDAWKGERLWLVALVGEVQEQNDKLAALERHIIREITEWKPT